MSRLLPSCALAILVSLTALSALAAEAEDKPAKPERDGPAGAIAQPDEFPDAPGFLALPDPAPAKPTPAQRQATPWWDRPANAVAAVATPAAAANHQRKIYRVKHLPANDLATTLSMVIQAEGRGPSSPDVMIVPDAITNSLVILGSESTVESAIELAEQLDVQPKMVQIRVLMAEIHADDDDAKGIGALLARLSNPDGSEDFDEVAAAIAGMPGVRLLGGPQLTLLDNQPGFLQIGRRVPRITSAQVSSRGRMNTVEMENVGLVLAVTARINDDGLVTMEVDLEKSQLGPADEGTPIAVPPEGDPIRATQVETLTCQTTIVVRDGQVTVLGGMASREGEMVILISPRIVEP